MDDYLIDQIGDVIEKMPGGDFDTLKQYLLEVISSDKPVVVTEKQSKMLAAIISSIITGGNFSIIELQNEYDLNELITDIENLETFSSNKH